MNIKEKDLIIDFALKKITKEDFLSTYSVNPAIEKQHVLQLLEKAYQEKNADDVDILLVLGFLFDVFSKDYIDILCKLIVEDWHYKHEDIALVLQKLKSPESIDALYKTALAKFEYLDYDDSYALARKCIHALGDMNTDYAKEKLKLLAASDIDIIKEKAEKQLYYYKR